MKPILSTVLLATMALVLAAPRCRAQDCEDEEYVCIYYTQSFDIEYDDWLLKYMAEANASIWIDSEDYGQGLEMKVTGVIYDPDPQAPQLAHDEKQNDQKADLPVSAPAIDSGLYEYMGDYFYCWDGDDWAWTEFDEWPSYAVAYLDPIGEYSTFLTWQEDYLNGVLKDGGLFNPITLLGHGTNGAMAPGEDYSGDTVQENISDVDDECWFSGSDQDQITGGGWGSSWTVSSGNTYGMDWINYRKAWFDYYRGRGSFCSASAVQSMFMIIQILAGPHSRPYDVHTVGNGVSPRYPFEYSWRSYAEGNYDW